MRGIFVGAGFNAFGIASGGGAGMALAEWVANGAPPYDLWPVDIRRFGRNHLGDALGSAPARSRPTPGTTPWPGRTRNTPPAARCRRSPLYDRLQAARRLLRREARLGAPELVRRRPARRREDIPTFGRPNWYAAVAREHRACREAAALFDQTSFAKFMLDRPRRRSGARPGSPPTTSTRPPGSLVYTQMLNERGGIECDLTVARLAEDAYYIVTGTGFATHDFDWIRRNIPAGLDARLTDVTLAARRARR